MRIAATRCRHEEDALKKYFAFVIYGFYGVVAEL